MSGTQSWKVVGARRPILQIILSLINPRSRHPESALPAALMVRRAKALPVVFIVQIPDGKRLANCTHSDFAADAASKQRNLRSAAVSLHKSRPAGLRTRQQAHHSPAARQRQREHRELVAVGDRRFINWPFSAIHPSLGGHCMEYVRLRR